MATAHHLRPSGVQLRFFSYMTINGVSSASTRYYNAALRNDNDDSKMAATTTFDVSAPPFVHFSNTIGHDNDILSMSPTFVSYRRCAMQL